MNKQMQDIRVFTEGGVVYIEQPHFENQDDSSIMIHKEQIDLLIAWLGEARDEKAVSDILNE